MKHKFHRGEYFAWRRHVIARQDRWARRLETGLAAGLGVAFWGGWMWLEYLQHTGKL